jgi:hypothetical protein
MLRQTLRTLSTGALSALLLFPAAHTHADVVSVASIGTTILEQGYQSGYLHVNIFDANPGVPAEAFGWSLGLRVVPLGGATGTVTIDQASIVYAPDPLFTDPFTALPGVTPNQPAAGDVTVFGSNDDFDGVLVPGTPKGMVSIKFNASANARGNFGLQLVDSGGLANTYWTNFNSAFDEPLHFNGTPITGLGGAQIGMITAIPEPSSLLLAGGVVGLAGWKARRRKRWAGVSPPPVESSAAAADRPGAS